MTLKKRGLPLIAADDRKSGIQRKIEADFNRLLEQVVTRDIPFLGACSGNGLLGNYLGTSISTRYAEAVGCVTLDITEAGKRDKLLRGFPDQIDVLLGHKEAVDTLPEGATLLMTGSGCPIQMFCISENVYATQFHPEGDADMIVTPCPVCQMNVEVYQNHINKTYKTNFKMPVVYYSTLMSVAYGKSGKEAGLDGQMIKAKQLEEIAGK